MKKLYIIAVLVVLYLLYKGPFTKWYLKRQSGLQAVAASALETGYTTYNTTIYTPPKWFPALNFFKAGAFVPSAQNTSQGSSSVNAAEYSTQG